MEIAVQESNKNSYIKSFLNTDHEGHLAFKKVIMDDRIFMAILTPGKQVGVVLALGEIKDSEPQVVNVAYGTRDKDGDWLLYHEIDGVTYESNGGEWMLNELEQVFKKAVANDPTHQPN